ncbi:O-methyltransferase [Haloechinothrix halophila]|uniref:O-methyltransferase n=1 Tax=Haloechinothrix halophila TaxID=1069073 RepID=UPI0004242A90|nr:class I SAM-dependent methyltransferase [Haloechinothrix halophila]
MTDPSPSTGRSIAVDPRLHEYALAHSTQPDAVQRALIDATNRATAEHAGMRISHDEGTFLTLLTQLTGARFAVEVGTFTGYSALCIARGLADGGTLLCCDVSEEWTSIGREHWQRAGVADHIDLRIAPALDTLRTLPGEPAIDLAFIDADKESYIAYWEELVPRMRPGGVLLVDNTLWHGTVADAELDETTRVITEFNDHAAADDRVDLVLLTLSDGVTMARRR